MPNGGPAPDCVHCKHYSGKPYNENKPYCTLHKVNLASQIYVFCSRYVDPEPDKNGDWLDQKLRTRAELQGDLMYLWLGGYEIPFFHVPLAPISEFANWTEDRFLDELKNLVDAHRNRLDKK